MSFERLTVRNFQVHDKLVVDLDPGVTCFVGPTDSGKSALFRALLWLCTNQPRGEAFLGNHGDPAGKCSVKLEFDGGERVLRVRGGGDNFYRCARGLLKAVGTTVPPEVSDALNLSPWSFQRQLDPPFWFLESPGQVSKNLNEVVDLGSIDRVVAHVASEVRAAKARQKVARENLKAVRAERDALKWVSDFDRELSEVEALETGYDGKRLSSSQLGLLLEAGRTLSRRQEAISGALGEAEKLLDLAGEATSKARRAERLGALVAQAEALQERLRAGVPDMINLQGARDRADRIAERNANYGPLADELTRLEGERCRLEKELAEAEKELGEVEACPACGRAL